LQKPSDDWASFRSSVIQITAPSRVECQFDSVCTAAFARSAITLAHDALTVLEALAYEAALEPSLWPQVAAGASRACEAPYMMLSVADRRANQVMHTAQPGLGELALRVTLRLRELEARATALAEMTDRALVALVLTDASGRVAEANGVGRAILAENDGLVLRDGVLRAARSEDCIRLARLIQVAAGSGTRGMRGVMQVSRPSSRRALALVVSSTRAAGSPFGRSHAVSVAFADPDRAPEADADLLARLYGFTPREAGVAALLLQGLSPSEAAGELAMTKNTIRTHIRHLFDKTGVERLAELVRLLMQGPGVQSLAVKNTISNRNNPNFDQFSPNLVISRRSRSTKVLASSRAGE
jgi:DNA-binding CsgD family transcriptional regulator